MVEVREKRREGKEGLVGSNWRNLVRLPDEGQGQDEDKASEGGLYSTRGYLKHR